MAGILIIAHEPLASALKDCIAHIYGGLPERVGVLDITSGQDSDQLVKRGRAELSRLNEGNGALVLTDLFGSTPANIAVQFATLPYVKVVTGVNLPMLVSAICYRTMALDELVDKVLAGSKKGIKVIGSTPPN